MADFEEYARYFHAGLRVEVGIRLPSRDMYREWGVLREYHDDVIVVELSRDHLPAGVILDFGGIVDVGVWVNEQVYNCNAIIIEKQSAVVYVIQLLSSITLKERREFFRIPAVLRLKYAIAMPGQTGADVRREWEKRMEVEYLRFLDSGSDYVDSMMFYATHPELRPAVPEPAWVDCIGTAVTICGGGIRLKLPRQLRTEAMVNVELHLPLKQTRIVHAVAEVIHVMEPVKTAGKLEQEYPTGMRFKWIENRDRELIIQYISSEQMEQLRRLSSSLRYPEDFREVTKKPLSAQQVAVRIVVAIVVLLFVYASTRYFMNYASKSIRNEIQSTYGDEIGKIRNKNFGDEKKP